ncbi:MAG: hypothetical protein AAF127_05340 [Pseudomonadota bacterium]
MMLTALTAAMLLQAAPIAPADTETVLAGSEYTKLPESWELTYDIAISPYLDDYKRCLGYENLVFGDTKNAKAKNVEEQHRASIARCAEEREDAITQSNAAMIRRGRQDMFTPDDVREAFKTVGYIHIQRGRNLDDQFKLQERAMAERRRRYAQQIAARDAVPPSQARSLDMPGAFEQAPDLTETSDVEN